MASQCVTYLPKTIIGIFNDCDPYGDDHMNRLYYFLSFQFGTLSIVFIAINLH